MRGSAVWLKPNVHQVRNVPHDGICVRDMVNTDFMEGVLLVSSTGFAPGSIYGLTLIYVHGYFAACAILDPVRSLARSLF